MQTIGSVHQITKRLTTGAWSNINLRGRRPRKKKYEKPGRVKIVDPKSYQLDQEIQGL